MATYEVWLTNDRGFRIAQLTTFTQLTASRVVNKLGRFSLVMPGSFDDNLIQLDNMIQVWRQPADGVMSLWNVYFLRAWEFDTRGSKDVVTLEGPDVKDVLRRRIAAAYTGGLVDIEVDVAADLMMELLVAESQVDGTPPVPDAGTRAWENFSVRTSGLGLGPTLTMSLSWDYLLTESGSGLLPKIAKAARQAGSEVFFDVIPNIVAGANVSLQFQTTVNQPGKDVSSTVTFDKQRGNMKNPKLRYDYSEEENYIYAAGQDIEAARNVQQVYDSTRYGVSVWNRCEGFADARDQTEDDGVIAAGQAKLDEGKGRIHFTATPIDTVSTRFGRDWDYGYKVTARYRSQEFITIVRAVSLSVDSNGNEDIQATLEYESAI